MISIELNVMNGLLFGANIAASILTGSTLQWILNNGMLKNQYNIIVTIATISSLIQTICCYINYLMYPNPNLGFVIFILINWVVMVCSNVVVRQ